MAKVTRKGNMIQLGNDQVRIEEGPPLKTAIATPELLSDDNTASHYYDGVRTLELPDGTPYEQPGIDALGKVIKTGEEMAYLDWGGSAKPGERVFYVYERVELDVDDKDSPHYVPPHARVRDTKDRTHYTYIFKEVGTRATEEAAIELGERVLAKMK